MRLCRERNANRVADAFVQENAQTDGRLDRSTKRGASFGHAKMERIINLLGEQTISCNSALHIRGFERDDSVCEIEVFENLYVAQGRFDHRFRRRRAVLL